MTKFPHIKKSIYITQIVDKYNFDLVFNKRVPFIEMEFNAELREMMEKGIEWIRFIHRCQPEDWYIDVSIFKVSTHDKYKIFYIKDIIDYHKPDGKQRNFGKKIK